MHNEMGKVHATGAEGLTTAKAPVPRASGPRGAGGISMIVVLPSLDTVTRLPTGLRSARGLSRPISIGCCGLSLRVGFSGFRLPARMSSACLACGSGAGKGKGHREANGEIEGCGTGREIEREKQGGK